MRIEFDPTNRDEATAVRAVLAALHPDAWAIGTEDGSFRVESDGRVAVSADVTRVIDASVTTEDGRSAGIFMDVPVTVTDANGEPHDPRIHSTPPKTNADGTWRAKRGVTAEQVAAVRAEREQVKDAVGALVRMEENFEAMQEVENFVPAQEQSAPPAPSAPVEEPAQKAPTPPAPPSVETHDLGHTHPVAPSFLDVMKAITAAQKDGKIDTAKVKELCAAVGAGESTMGLNGPDNGDKRQVFLQVLNLEAKERDAIIEAAKGEPGLETVRTLLGGA